MATRTKPANVVLVGRVNVGKSTLFNRLVGRDMALTSPLPGTTRDRREAPVRWAGREFVLVDTGGVEAPRSALKREGRDDLAARIALQTETAITGADLALFVVSAVDGVLPQDREWARAIVGRVPTVLVINKADSDERELNAADFYDLGLGTPHLVSATSGRRSGDLLDAVVHALSTLPTTRLSRRAVTVGRGINLAILGQPNAGKSSLLNALVGEERIITSPKPHTTREPQDIGLTYRGARLTLIDTAGIRRRHHQAQGLERQGIAASLKTVERADVVLLLIDVAKGPTVEDQHLGRLVVDHGKGLVLVINKWDLVEKKGPSTTAEVARRVRAELPGLDWAPLVTVSAKTKLRVHGLLDTALSVAAARGQHVEAAALTDVLAAAVRQHRPARGGGVRHPRAMTLEQTGTKPPRFRLSVSGELHPSYLKFIERRLRMAFGFTGTPIALTLEETTTAPRRKTPATRSK